MMSKRKLLLALPVFTGMALALVGAHDHLVGDNVGMARIVAAFVDPLAVLARRSPGQRGFGALRLTKPDRQAANAKPHERVLSTVRERPPASNFPLGGDNLFQPAAPGGASGGPDTEQSSAARGQSPTSPFRYFPVGFFPGGFGQVPGGYVGTPGTPVAVATPSESPPAAASNIPSEEGAEFQSVATGSQNSIPYQIAVAPQSGPVPGGEGGNPDNLGPAAPLVLPPEFLSSTGGQNGANIAVPEPPSWTMMLLGLLIVAMMRRRERADDTSTVRIGCQLTVGR
jgi:hypothetical protein